MVWHTRHSRVRRVEQALRMPQQRQEQKTAERELAVDVAGSELGAAAWRAQMRLGGVADELPRLRELWRQLTEVEGDAATKRASELIEATTPVSHLPRMREIFGQLVTSLAGERAEPKHSGEQIGER